MAGRLSFSIAINLLTENFKKGTNNVKNGFRSMQMQVLTFAAALGVGGLGLSDFVSRLITVARETSRVTTALKNVSGSLGQFADNQRFLLDMAKKYGLEINALTGNFAKFTAASQVSGMSMMNQRKIFESVSRAATAFGMSAEDSNGVFLALSQMMSKGKISSEELRLQMGERLPIALQAMAKAAGVSVAGLDKLLKQGKLMSADVLPRFADALNEMIPNVDTDNLETSINRLKNMFTEFAKSMDVQGKYKGMIDWITRALSGLESKVSGLVAFVITMVSGKLLGSITGYFGQFWKFIDTTVSKSKTAEAQKLLFTQKRIEAEKLYEATLTEYNTIENGKRLSSKAKLAKAEKALDAARLSEKKAILTAGTAAENAAAVSSTTVWGKAMNTLKLGFVQFGRTLKAVFMSAWPLLLLSVISSIVAKIVSAREEAKRIKSIFSDYKAEADKAVNSQEVVMLNQQLKIMNDKKQSQEDINNAQAQLQKSLGKEYKSQKELNDAVRERIKLLEDTARAQFHAGKIPEIEEKNKELKKKFKEDHGGNPRYSMDDMLKTISDYGYQNKSGLPSGFRAKFFLKGTESSIRSGLDEYFENLKSLNFSRSEIERSIISSNKVQENKPLGDDPKKSDLQKMEEKYAHSLRELDARREVEKMSLADYNKAVDELAKNMLIEAKASGDKEILTSDYIKMLADVLDNPLYSETQDKLNQVEAEYTKAIELAKTKLDKKIISEDEYVSSIIDAATSAANSAVYIDGIGNAANEFIKKVQGKSIAAIEDGTKPILGKRDATFDYKKNDADKISGELDVWKKYKDELEDLKAKHKGLTKELQEELTKAIEKIPNLEQALKIAEIKEDVKQFSKELNEGIYSGVKDIASSADRLVSSFQALNEAFDPDSEANGWERLMAVWSAMTNVVDSFLSVAKMMENLTELTNKLILAKQTEATIDTALTGTKVANAATQTTATTTALATQTTAEVAASATKSTAASVEMAAKSTAAYAAIPFVGVGLAAAQIAAMEAMIMAAGLPKFANGGIVSGGPTSGDKILARVNAGEMILNAGQQSRLFEAINSGRLGSSRNINIGFDRVRGGDILLSLNNTLKKQGKKPL